MGASSMIVTGSSRPPWSSSARSRLHRTVRQGIATSNYSEFSRMCGSNSNSVSFTSSSCRKNLHTSTIRHSSRVYTSPSWSCLTTELTHSIETSTPAWWYMPGTVRWRPSRRESTRKGRPRLRLAERSLTPWMTFSSRLIQLLIFQMPTVEYRRPRRELSSMSSSPCQRSRTHLRWARRWSSSLVHSTLDRWNHISIYSWWGLGWNRNMKMRLTTTKLIRSLYWIKWSKNSMRVNWRMKRAFTRCENTHNWWISTQTRPNLKRITLISLIYLMINRLTKMPRKIMLKRCERLCLRQIKSTYKQWKKSKNSFWKWTGPRTIQSTEGSSLSTKSDYL